MFNLLFRQQVVKRWQLFNKFYEDNDLMHSARVAMLAGYIAYKVGYADCDYVAMCALYHDVTEVITGDVPSVVKRSTPELAEACKRLEEQTKRTMIHNSSAPDYFSRYLTEVDAYTQRIVKCADVLDAALFAIREVASGNVDFKKVKEVYIKRLYNEFSDVGCVFEIMDEYKDAVADGFSNGRDELCS